MLTVGNGSCIMRHMRLEQWIPQNDGMQKDFAKRAGIAQPIVSRICNFGDARGRVWAKVIKATNGEVSPVDHFPPPARRGRPPLGKGAK